MPLVRNLTPFELAMCARQRAPVDGALQGFWRTPGCAPFAEVDIPQDLRVDELLVHRRGFDPGARPLATISISEPDQTVSITVDQLHSNPDPSLGFTRTRTFENCTSEWIDIIKGDEQRSRVATLGPGERYTDADPLAHVWIFRSAFSNEVVHAFHDGDNPAYREWTCTIGDDFRPRLAIHAPLPSPLPGKKVELIPSGRATLKPEDKAFITTEDRDGLVKPKFNGRTNVVPRRVKVVGAKLIWNAKDNNYGLMSLQDEDVLDLESLEMIADEVIIGSPLRMPGTNVSITARRVEFADDGMIDTSPPPLLPPNFPGPPDTTNGPVSYTAQDGDAGLPGGSVTLVAQTLITGDATKKRIVTRGGQGGKAEPGGLLKYRPKAPRHPYTKMVEEGQGPDCAVVTWEDVAKMLPVWFGATDAKWLEGWWWPGGADAPNKCIYNGKPLGMAVGPGHNDAGHNNVVSLVVTAHDDRHGGVDTNWFRFPEYDTRVQRNLIYPTRTFFQHDASPKGDRTVPGDGRDAYPGGKPGKGGAAGVVCTTPELAAVVAQICDVRGGDPGPATAAVNGGPAGKANGHEVALLVDMTILRRGSNRDLPRYPRSGQLMWVDEYRAKPGQSAPARTANPGPDGEVRSQAASWLRVEAIDAVLACARTAFRDGHRGDAREAIEPYYVALRDPSRADNQQFSAQKMALSAMRDNLMANLDYYGNPPGWLPRLRVSTNLALFSAIRQASYKLLYFATTTEEKYNDLEHRQTLAGEVRAALHSETQACLKAITEATKELAEARLELSKIAAELGAKQQALDNLKNLAEAASLIHEERQRIFKGVMKVVGGVMQAVPVGQPYLGAGGSLISGIGDIDFFTSDKPAEQAAAVLGKIGAATDSFLADNGDLLAKDLTANLRREVNLGTKQVKQFSQQVTQAEGEAEELEAQVAKWSKPIEHKLEEEAKKRSAELVSEKARIKGILTKHAAGENPNDDDVDELLNKAFDKKPGSRVELLSLERDLNSITTKISEVEQEIAALGTVTTALDKHRLGELKARKELLTEAQQRVTDLKTEQAAAEEKIEELESTAAARQKKYTEAIDRLKTMGTGITGIGAGISTLATPVSKDDPAVKNLAERLLKTQDAQRYQQVMKDMGEVGARQSAQMEKLCRAQSNISSNVARMAESLATQNNLGRSLHNLDNALDVRAKQYLQGMRLRAWEMFQSAMYHLVMAYRYEALKDLPDSFVNYDRIVAALQKLDRADRATPPTGGTAVQPKDLDEAVQQLTINMTKPTEDDLQKLDDTILKFEFLKLGVEIATQRQHRAQPRKFILTEPLNAQQLDQLSQLHTITFNLVKDFGRGADYDWLDARIADIDLKELQLKTEKDLVSMRVEFRHSGESIINGGTNTQPRYYYFRAAASDDPVVWGFQATAKKAKKKKAGVTDAEAGASDAEEDLEAEIKADEKVDDLEPILTKALDDKKIEFEEYWPSLFSDITLDIDPGKDVSVEITGLVFDVKVSKRQ